MSSNNTKRRPQNTTPLLQSAKYLDLHNKAAINTVTEYQYAKQEIKGGNPLISLISKGGDVHKSVQSLKQTLHKVKFPEEFDEEAAQQGHPTPYLKILHYGLFEMSSLVSQHIYTFDKTTRENVNALNDFNFYGKVVHLLVNVFHYRPTILIDQFFKYGFAEAKMILCADALEIIRLKHKSLQIEANLNSTTRSSSRKSRSQSASKILNRTYQSTRSNYDDCRNYQSANLSQVKFVDTLNEQQRKERERATSAVMRQRAKIASEAPINQVVKTAEVRQVSTSTNQVLIDLQAQIEALSGKFAQFEPVVNNKIASIEENQKNLEVKISELSQAMGKS